MLSVRCLCPLGPSGCGKRVGSRGRWIGDDQASRAGLSRPWRPAVFRDWSPILRLGRCTRLTLLSLFLQTHGQLTQGCIRLRVCAVALWSARGTPATFGAMSDARDCGSPSSAHCTYRPPRRGRSTWLWRDAASGRCWLAAFRTCAIMRYLVAVVVGDAVVAGVDHAAMRLPLNMGVAALAGSSARAHACAGKLVSAPS